MRRGPSERYCSVAQLAALALAFSGCASAAALDLEQDSTQRDAGIYDLAQGPDLSGDLATPYTPDLAGAELAGSPHDLAMSGCTLSSLKVNEVSTAGTGGATDEYVELYNPCTSAVPLAGGQLIYRAATATSDTFAITAFVSGQTIASHGYFLVANSGYSASADVKPFAAGATGLAAPGGGVALEDANGTRIDSVGWGTATNAFVEGSVVAAPASGQSAARHPDGTDTNDNATDFVLEARTPDAAN